MKGKGKRGEERDKGSRHISVSWLPSRMLVSRPRNLGSGG